MIDLRSDTVTRPTAGMRQAMADAEVGDDVYGEDPSAIRLQERAAELLGQEAALFVPTGTMANQLALLCHCERGNDVLVGEGNHVMVFESGAAAAWAQVQFSVLGHGGLFRAEDLIAAIKPADAHFPQTRLCTLENTHNRAGGRVFPQAEVLRIAQAARAHQLALHVDGARIWNASIATGLPTRTLGAPASSISACFSKGLGAPAGSVLAGSRQLIARAHRYRKMLGGGMRQVGVLCAAALYALDHHVERLADDHAHAKRLAEGLSAHPQLLCDPAQVETNIVVFEVRTGPAQDFVTRAAQAGIRLNPISPTRIRAVTHLDITAPDIEQALKLLSKL